MSLAPAVLDRLAGPDAEALVLAATEIPPSPALLDRLRKAHGAEVAAAACEVVGAREAARRKFGARAATLWADREGVEQATPPRLAAWKAEAFRGAGARVIDLCSGIGTDAAAFAAAGLETLAVDRDPGRAWMSARNAGCPSRTADVVEVAVAGALVHLDPARRARGRRLWRLEDLEPGPEAIARCAKDAAGTLVKLGPGLDLASCPDAAEVEIVSLNGRLVAAHLRFGALRPAARRAILLRGSESFSFAGDPGAEAGTTEETPPFLLVLDPSLERAELAAAYARSRELPFFLDPALGLLAAPSPAGDVWTSAFRLIDFLPWQERRVRAAVRAADGGEVAVKIRGRATPTSADVLARRLSGVGSRALVVFVLRVGSRRLALLTERLAGGEPG